jgi:hypothetical protein
VSKDSHAEKLGICFRDIIECFNGKRISTTIEVGACICIEFQLKWNERICIYVILYALDFVTMSVGVHVAGQMQGPF